MAYSVPTQAPLSDTHPLWKILTQGLWVFFSPLTDILKQAFEVFQFVVMFCFSFSHAQGLAALQAYCHWMAQYYLETHRQQQHQGKFVALVSNSVDALVPLLNKEVSWCLGHNRLAQSNFSYASAINAKCSLMVGGCFTTGLNFDLSSLVHQSVHP